MKSIYLIIGLLFLVISVSASINVTATSISESAITWVWEQNLSVNNLSVDGYRILLADYNQNSFTLSGLNANEIHTINVYTSTDNGTISTKTVSAVYDSSLAIIFGYIFFIAAILAILIGTKIPVFAWIGCGLSIVGIVDMITINFWSSFVFMVIFCAGVLVALSPSE
jgi:hypothetical protein